MKRRELIAAGSVAAIGAVAGTALGVGAASEADVPAYRGNEPVRYDHDELELALRPTMGSPGETVELEATNTGDSRVSVGCNTPWALQRRTAEGWSHVTWTAGRFYYLCAQLIPPGGSVAETVELSEAALESQAAELESELRPSTYRFVLVGTSPYLATEFTLRGAV